MVFNSYGFLFVFLPIILVIYYMCGKVFRKDFSNVILSVASSVFVACSGIFNVIMLLISVCINYIMNTVLNNTEQEKYRKIIASINVILNILFLCFFKYMLPIAQNGSSILMPLGISFYTFQQISYTIDNYRHNFHKKYGFINYLLSVMFFVKFLQGPITYHDELIPQFQDRTKNKFLYENFSKGLYILCLGLTKKVLVADNFAKIVDYGYGHIPTLNPFEALLTVVAYSLQLYFDFSGYCDMALGIAKMFNIDLPVNFNSPYKAKNISDFWKRWHITLTRFLTKYLYIPLGGSRRGAFFTYVNIMIVFLVSGCWHGTGITFVVWGLMHGMASVLYRIFKEKYDRFPEFIQWLCTFIYVNITWIVFRASNITDALELIKRIFVGGGTLILNAELIESLLQPTIISILSRFLPVTLVVIMLVIVAVLICVFAKNTNELVKEFVPRWSNLILIYILFA